MHSRVKGKCLGQVPGAGCVQGSEAGVWDGLPGAGCARGSAQGLHTRAKAGFACFMGYSLFGGNLGTHLRQELWLFPYCARYPCAFIRLSLQSAKASRANFAPLLPVRRCPWSPMKHPCFTFAFHVATLILSLPACTLCLLALQQYSPGSWYPGGTAPILKWTVWRPTYTCH